MKVLASVGVAVALLVVGGSSALADTIDFEGAWTSQQHSNGDSGVFYTEDGMSFDYQGSSDAWAVGRVTGTAGSPILGFTSTFLDFHDHNYDTPNGNTYVEMRLAGGGVFDLNSAEVYGEALSYTQPSRIYSNLGTIWSSLGNTSTAVVNFNSNNAGVAWVRFESGYDISVDNINFAPVPEPGTMALMGLGLMGAGIARRRRQRSSSAA